MFNFKCIATGSTGNCYVVQTTSGCFLLDAGCKSIDNIIKNVNLNDVNFAFISHMHNDHSRQQENLVLRGVSVVKGNLIQEFTEIASKSLKSMLYQAWCFPVEHGKENCSGIIIKDNADGELILYVTDLTNWSIDLSKFKFTRVIVECNYIESLAVGASNKYRAMDNIDRHLGLRGTKKLLSTLDISKLEEIILVHMSQNFGNSLMMGSSIYNDYELPVKVCRQYGGFDLYGGC